MSAQKMLEDNGILPENTSLRKLVDKDVPGCELLIASSVVESKEKDFSDANDSFLLKTTLGDHSATLTAIIEELQLAQTFANEETQIAMLSELQQSLKTGDMQAFKRSQELWVKDQSPTVETSIGFLETYQDPFGVRASWQGLVAVVNKVQSRKCSDLVEQSSDFIAMLPWNGTCSGFPLGTNSAFENIRFKKPDFTNLDGEYLASTDLNCKTHSLSARILLLRDVDWSESA